MRSRWLGYIIAFLAAAASLWAYPRMPETVATHWNLRGQPDGYGSRTLVAVLMPALLAGLTAFFQVLPQIDPVRAREPRFASAYWLVVNGALLFLAAVHLMVLGNGIGAPVGPGVLVPAAIGLLLIVSGVHFSGAPHRTTVGLHTPWTRRSERVWRATHRGGALLFVAGGLLVGFVGVVEPRAAVSVALATIAVLLAVPAVASYLLSTRERR